MTLYWVKNIFKQKSGCFLQFFKIYFLLNIKGWYTMMEGDLIWGWWKNTVIYKDDVL